MSLTPARLRVLCAMDRLWRDHPEWRWPTLRELSALTGICTITLYEHLERLAEDGYVHRAPDVARGSSIPPADLLDARGRSLPRTSRIPVVGVLRSGNGTVEKPASKLADRSRA